MKKESYQILRKVVPNVELVSLTSQNWYDHNHNLIPWSDSPYLAPSDGDAVYNITGDTPIGWYIWSGSSWMSVTSGETYEDHQLPIFLEDSVDEMGIMVGFTGEMEQVEQFCNFTYTINEYLVTVYNTLNTNKLKTLVDSVFTISWGDGELDTEVAMPTVYDANLTSAWHIYASSGSYDIEVTVDSPWKVEKIQRTIEVPFTGATYPTDLGTLIFTVPYSNPLVTGVTQDYLQDYTTLTGNPDPSSGVTISFLAVGKSRLDEFKLYGSSYDYSGITITADYTGYTIDNLHYMDYPDGYTYITGNTLDFYMEEVYDGMITRDEHLIGFLDQPAIYSDIFVERGKLGVMERNLRLGEIDNVGELEIYGSGFFKVEKQ